MSERRTCTLDFDYFKYVMQWIRLVLLSTVNETTAAHFGYESEVKLKNLKTFKNKYLIQQNDGTTHKKH